MKQISTSIMIDATADRVWEILTDFPGHPSWNPFIRAISGPLEQGGRLEVQIAPPGQKGMTFRPRLLVVEPGRELRWKGRLLVPGLFDGEHFFVLEPDGDRTRFIHGEEFSGIFVTMMGSASFDRIRAGFEAMNAALKQEAEAR